MKAENIDEYRWQLSIGQVIVVRQNGEDDKWIPHGTSFNVDSRWSGGYQVDACVTGACMMIGSVAVIFRRSNGSLVVLSVDEESQKKSVFEKLMCAEGGYDNQYTE